MRSSTRVGGDLRKSKVLAVLMLTLRGAATIYMGEEIGMTNRPVPLARARDGQARTFAFLPDRVVRWLERALRETINRDEVRTPMHWDASENAGFCPEGVRPWLPVHENRRERSVAAQVEDSASLLSLHRRLLRLRRERPALRDGSVEVLPTMPDGVLGIVRRSPTDQVAVYLNFDDRPRSLPCPPVDSLLATNPGTGVRDGRLWLEPQSAIVLALPAPEPS
jgi:alpha-glucosidase